MKKCKTQIDITERFDYGGIKSHCGEITKKQTDIYVRFGVSPPSMV